MTPPPFRPARLLANPHVQTLWPTLRRKLPPVARREEKMPLPDGDHLWLHWGATRPENGRIVVLLHGITGCSDSPYARGLQHELDKIGTASVVTRRMVCDKPGYGGNSREAVGNPDRTRAVAV